MRTQFSSPVVLNEILPSPEGEDAKEEWIEIFNDSYDTVDLSGWKITDTKGSVKTYIFPKNSQILGQGFLLLKRPQTKITLNNDFDGLQLIQGETILDSVEYTKSPVGQSFNRTQSGWAWSKTLTPRSKNVITSAIPQDNKPKETTKQILKQPEKNKSFETEKQTADIGNQFPKNNFSFKFLFLALGIAFFSGLTMLFLKKRLKE